MFAEASKANMSEPFFCHCLRPGFDFSHKMTFNLFSLIYPSIIYTSNRVMETV